MVAKLGEVMWVIDLNRQSLDRVVPDIAAGRLAGMFEAAGWHVEMVKYGAAAEAADRVARPHRRDAQRGVPAAAAGGRGGSAAAARGRRPARRRRRAAGRLPRPRRPRPRRADRGLPQGRSGARPAERRLRLHDQGLAAADRGPSRQPLGAAVGRAVRRAGRRRSAPTPTTRGRASSTARRRPSCARRPPRGWSASRCGSVEPPAVPPTLGREHRGRESTQQAFGRFWVDLEREAPEVAARVVTVSPDVGTSTNLGGWINKAGIWNVGERIDWFADDTDTLVRWRESDHGQHMELGIAEVNLVGLLGELGATWSRDGQPLLPVGTIYDPFLARALEPWSFGIYAGGQSILVGTPSGVTLGPEGGAHQSVVTPSIGIEQPGCVAWEPAFGRDFEWTFLHALSRLGRPDGSSAYFRLSTRPIDQSLAGDAAREHVLAGGYRLREGSRLTIAVMGALVPEAMEAAERARRRGRLHHQRRPAVPRLPGPRGPGRGRVVDPRGAVPGAAADRHRARRPSPHAELPGRGPRRADDLPRRAALRPVGRHRGAVRAPPDRRRVGDRRRAGPAR